MPAAPARPDVSIVIPTRDRSHLLRRALDSVAAQTCGRLEVVVVDDGDGSGGALARSHGARPVRTLDNGGCGQVAARNLGVGAATGRWIAFLDDDDWWDGPGYLDAMLRAVAPGGMAYAGGRIVHEDAAGTPAGWLPFRAHADAASIRVDNTLLVSGLLFERDLHARLGSFDESLPVYWDWDWYLRLFEAGVPVRPAATDAVRISARPGTVSAAANESHRREDLARLAAKHALTGLVLRSHESIARDEAGERRY